MDTHADSTRLPLPADEVHVWSASLELPAAKVASFARLLSADEQARLARIRCPRTRDEFAVGRGILRTLLGAYLEQAPSSIRLTLGPIGKPELSERADPALHFNLSHSRGLALFAFTKCCPVGVDVEHVRPMSNFLGLAERYFSAREVEILRCLPDESQIEAFFHAWTRKEAFLKARGVGLSYGLERVEVTLGANIPARLLRLDGEEGSARSWSLCNLDLTPGYIGALALEQREFRLVCRNWPQD